MGDPAASSDCEGPNGDGRVARRAVLRRLGYLIPAVLGSFVVARRAEAQASCLPSCCNPTDCQPQRCCLPERNCLPWLCTPFNNCPPFN